MGLERSLITTHVKYMKCTTNFIHIPFLTSLLNSFDLKYTCEVSFKTSSVTNKMHLWPLYLCTSAASLIEAAKPNVVLIVIDDLRPSVLGCYNQHDGLVAKTPNIDSLASENGAVFTSAFAQQALCAPSRTSFLTSRRPDTTKLYDLQSGYWRKVAGNFSTLPQVFKENGYETISMGKVFHSGHSSNGSLDFPYSWTSKPFIPSTNKYKNKSVCPGEDGELHHNLLCPVDVEKQPEGTLPDLQVAEKAQKFLSEASKPFFLAVGFYKPHVPFKVPKEYLDLYPHDEIPLPLNKHKPENLPDVAWNTWNSLERREDIAALNLSFPFGEMPDYWSREIRRFYLASTTYIDDQVGKVLKAIKDKNNTIVALIGDHGWSLGEHQEWAKFSNFEVAVKVPFIIKDFRKNKFVSNRFSEPVELLDLFPTLVDLAGLEAVEKCPKNSSKVKLCTDGRSLRPLLNGLERHQEPFFAFSQYPRPSLEPHIDTDQPRLKHIRFMGYSLRTKYYRYTEWVAFDRVAFKPNFCKVEARELYNRFWDPEENHNKANSWLYKGVQKILAKILREKFSHQSSNCFI